MTAVHIQVNSFRATATAAALRPLRLAIRRKMRRTCSSVRMAVQAACCRIHRRSGEPVLAMCPIRCFPPEAKTRGLSPA